MAKFKIYEPAICLPSEKLSDCRIPNGTSKTVIEKLRKPLEALEKGLKSEKQASYGARLVRRPKRESQRIRLGNHKAFWELIKKSRVHIIGCFFNTSVFYSAGGAGTGDEF